MIMMFGFVRGIARGLSSILAAAALELICFGFVLLCSSLFCLVGGGVWIYGTCREHSRVHPMFFFCHPNPSQSGGVTLTLEFWRNFDPGGFWGVSQAESGG